MAQIGAEDGRPMVVLLLLRLRPGRLADADLVAPQAAGVQGGSFPDLEFEVRRVALTPDQVREYGLPSTPLKATEQRADAWTAAMGVEQTEIDALAALQPALLRDLAREAINPYFDPTLKPSASRSARDAWRADAQTELDDQMDEDHKVRMQCQLADLVHQFAGADRPR